jgi:hypothetical protein
MRRLFVAILLSGLIALVIASPSGAQEYDHDCADFLSQSEAQRYFFDHGGAPKNNVDRLDSDGDGWACEFNDPPYFSGFSATQVNEHINDENIDDVGNGTDDADHDADDVPASELPKSGTGGYLSKNAVSLSPLMLLGSAAVLGATLVAGGLRVRRSLR